MSQDTRRGLAFTREQVEEWIGHPVSDDDLIVLENVLPYSSLPECVEVVAHEALGIEWHEEDGA